jgi:hypothetical protein
MHSLVPVLAAAIALVGLGARCSHSADAVPLYLLRGPAGAPDLLRPTPPTGTNEQTNDLDLSRGAQGSLGFFVTDPAAVADVVNRGGGFANLFVTSGQDSGSPCIRLLVVLSRLQGALRTPIGSGELLVRTRSKGDGGADAPHPIPYRVDAPLADRALLAGDQVELEARAENQCDAGRSLKLFFNLPARPSHLTGSDNCPALANPDQADGDDDGVGDACDSCPSVPNPDQADADGDGVADACDLCPDDADPAQADGDADGVGDACDVCPLVADPAQADADADGAGDFCDVCPGVADPDQHDLDGDGAGDACDNCPASANADQGDADADDVGDACDNCPAAPNGTQSDTDADGRGNACDNCPAIPNPTQADADGDAVGNACDVCADVADPAQGDADADGKGNACDNCDAAPNPDQADADADTVGDACDVCPARPDPEQADRDGDAVGDACDICPLVPDLAQADVDHDGVGDGCQCHSPAPAGTCIPGGGNKTADCLVQLIVVPTPPLDARTQAPTRKVRCRDGDPGCDRDGTIDGGCSFELSLCANTRDPRLVSCTARDIATIAATPAALAAPVLAALPLSAETCYAPFALRVPLRFRGAGVPPTRATARVKVKAQTPTTVSGRLTDSDSFSFVCDPPLLVP